MPPATYPIFSPEYYMNEALKEAQKAYDRDEVPVGAVVVCNRTIIARAHNLTETLNDATAHAEMQAFTAAAGYLGGKYLDECTLYVTLEPCVMCAGAMLHARVDRVVFGARDPKTGAAGSVVDIFSINQLNHQTTVDGGVLESECGQVLKDFFKERR